MKKFIPTGGYCESFHLIMFLIFSEWENWIEVSALQQSTTAKKGKKNKTKSFVLAIIIIF